MFYIIRTDDKEAGTTTFAIQTNIPRRTEMNQPCVMGYLGATGDQHRHALGEFDTMGEAEEYLGTLDGVDLGSADRTPFDAEAVYTKA